MIQDFATDFKSVFLRYVHSWFIRSLFWPSTQCISTTTSPSSHITFNRHLNKNCSTELGLWAGLAGSLAAEVDSFFGSPSCAAPADADNSISASSSGTFSMTSFCSPLGFWVTHSLVSREAELLGSNIFCADMVLFWMLTSWVSSVCATVGTAEIVEVCVLVPGQGGALGSSRSWRRRSRLFCRPWIHVFSTAVKKRLCSCVLQGTCLWSTCGVTEMNKTGKCWSWQCVSDNAALKLTRRSLSIFSSRPVMPTTALQPLTPKSEALASSSFSPASGRVNDRGFRGFSSLRLLLGGD